MATETTNFVPDGEAPNGQFKWAAHPRVEILGHADIATLQTAVNDFMDALGLPLDETRKYSVPRVNLALSETIMVATLEYIEWHRK